MHSESIDEPGPQTKLRNKSFKPNKEMNKSLELDETPLPLSVALDFELSLQVDYPPERQEALQKWNTHEGNNSVVDEQSNETSLARSLTPLSSNLVMLRAGSN